MKKFFNMMKEDVEGVVLVVMTFAVMVPVLMLCACIG